MAIPKDIEEALVAIAERFPTIEQILLFGSRAYGDHAERSDIDLVVIAPDIKEEDWFEFTLLLEDDLETLLKIDLIRWETASVKLKEEINQCHKVIYQLRGNSMRH
jgi:predicted nucleotidyltransferase